MTRREEVHAQIDLFGNIGKVALEGDVRGRPNRDSTRTLSGVFQKEPKNP